VNNADVSDVSEEEFENSELPGMPMENTTPSTKLDVTGSRQERPRSSISSRRSSLSKINNVVDQLNNQSGAIETKLQYLLQKLDDLQAAQFRSDVDKETGLLGKIRELIDTAADRTEKSIGDASHTLSCEVNSLGVHSSAILEQVTSSSKGQEATMADMRRQQMMLMELISSDRDTLHNKIQDLSVNIAYAPSAPYVSA